MVYMCSDGGFTTVSQCHCVSRVFQCLPKGSIFKKKLYMWVVSMPITSSTL